MRKQGRLNAARIAQLTEPGRFADGSGLYLQISDYHTRSWLLRFELHGKERMMGLGSFEDVTLAQARELARAAHRLLNDGFDPIEQRKARKAALKAESARVMLFKDVAAKYVESNKAAWRSTTHPEQVANAIRDHANPTLGKLDVRTIETGDIVRALEAIWTTKNPTATRLLRHIEAILDYATARKYRSGDNPARWRGHLENLLPDMTKKVRVRHMPSLPYVEVPNFMRELREKEGISARALEFTILTATRSGESLNAKWDEFDLDGRVWTVPASRTKSGREYRVPLSDKVIQILEGLPRIVGSEEFVFPGKPGKPLSDGSMLKMVQRMRGSDIVPHGFRSSFRTWAQERTAFPREVAEMALGHVIGDETERSYARGDLFAKRAKLMTAWATYCKSTPVKASVTPINKRSA